MNKMIENENSKVTIQSIKHMVTKPSKVNEDKNSSNNTNSLNIISKLRKENNDLKGDFEKKCQELEDAKKVCLNRKLNH